MMAAVCECECVLIIRLHSKKNDKIILDCCRYRWTATVNGKQKGNTKVWHGIGKRHVNWCAYVWSVFIYLWNVWWNLIVFTFSIDISILHIRARVHTHTNTHTQARTHMMLVPMLFAWWRWLQPWCTETHYNEAYELYICVGKWASNRQKKWGAKCREKKKSCIFVIHLGLIIFKRILRNWMKICFTSMNWLFRNAIPFWKWQRWRRQGSERKERKKTKRNEECKHGKPK